MSELDEIRRALDKTDEELLNVLEKRMNLVERVAKAKRSDPDTQLRDRKREKELLSSLAKKARDRGLNPYYVKRIFDHILEYSMDDQERFLAGIKEPGDAKTIRVAYQGVEGAYSFLAAGKYFAGSREDFAYLGFRSFSEAVRACEAGEVDYAVLPVENTIAGSINATYRLLEDSVLRIIGEEIWPVQHCLIGLEKVPLTRIRRIASHPQALLQCGEFLSQLGRCVIESYWDTAEAVRRVKEEQDITHAAIASEDAADIYGLKVLKRNIADQRENFTKFIIVAKNPIDYDPRIPSKVSIVLVTDHSEGSLMACLAPFHEHGLNLLKLESRSHTKAPWEYRFFIDFEGRLGDPKVDEALEQIRTRARYIKILGSYPIRGKKSEPVDIPLPAMDRESPEASKPRKKPADPPAMKTAPYKLASLAPGRKRTEIMVGKTLIGGGAFTIMAGPCAVESREQVFEAARIVREHGGGVLRGGVFKPRSSPYSFQGLGYEGLEYLCEAGRAHGLPVITEVLHPNDVRKVAADADILQIGARNMQNFALLAEVGRARRPVMLKRGMMASIEELLLAAEYVLAEGNTQVILCERGIRTFETATRATLDLLAVPVLKSLTHLPVIVDPSHAAGQRHLVAPMALAAAAAGADGIIVEVHPNPDEALCDGPQALTEELFADMARRIGQIRKVLTATI